MAEIDVTPYVLKDCIFEVDDDDFAAALSGVVFTPSASTVTFTGLKPDSIHTDMSTATWVCALTYAQDVATVASLTNYLHANEGDAVEATFKPVSGSGPTITATIIITPGALGGQGGQFATSTVNLGVRGKPAIVPAA